MLKNTAIFIEVFNLFILFSIIALSALDRLSKIYVAFLLEDSGELVILPGLVKLRLLSGGNTGAAFGIFRGNVALLIVFTSLFIAVGIYLLYFKKFTSRLSYVSVLLIVAGGLGNLYDRIVYRGVADFIEFIFMDFPTFNLADIYVTVGAVLLLISVIALKNNPFFVHGSKPVSNDECAE